ERDWYISDREDDCRGESVIQPEDRLDHDKFADAIMKDIEALADRVKELIIVSSEYDIGEDVQESTKMYIELLDLVNERLKLFADNVHMFNAFQ
ncbi:MAG: hypothetical protein IK123_00815, partial [Lachnospiraceae bacterium]|nr:hypothetical protein [Lachnospiraceae bacterium]